MNKSVDVIVTYDWNRVAYNIAMVKEFFIKHPEHIAIMGRESRSYAEERSDVHKMNAVMLREMELKD